MPPNHTTADALTGDDVVHLARLARIDLDPAERDVMAGQLSGILAAVARVQAVAGPDVPATSHPLPLVNVMRADEARPGLSADEALSGAPARQGDRFRVPRILEED